MRELPNMVRVLSAIAVLAGAACGDDDGGSGGGPGAGSGGGADAGSDVEGSESWPCTGPDECLEGLRCAETPITLDTVPIGVCGVPCGEDGDCGSGACISYGGEDDKHCVDVVDADFALCGIADTSICVDEKVCLYLPGEPVGVCVTLCALDAAADGDGDAGVSLGGCGAGQDCLDAVLAEPEPNEGVCGTLVGRGDECGVDLGLFCEAGDLCAPEIPDDSRSTFRCLQDCAEDEACDEGSCTPNLGRLVCL